MSEDYVLELEHIRKEYPGVVALKDVTLQLRRGEVLGLIGENGAGKSTLIKCCSGAVVPTSGKIKVNGNACWHSVDHSSYGCTMAFSERGDGEKSTKCVHCYVVCCLLRFSGIRLRIHHILLQPQRICSSEDLSAKEW